MQSKGYIRSASEVEARKGITGHPNVTAYRLVHPGEDGVSYLLLTLDDIEPGGGIDAHYHADVDTFDHAYYVISGEIAAKVGDQEEKIVGEDTVIYFPSNVVHRIKNVGTTNAKVLRLGAAASGESHGKLVYMEPQP
ncbi:MAG: cupin domain-containing protein [Chloroflexi bacterium]|nr:cupin domain-containing protein [Chloroflexota bacterium]